VLLLDSHHLYFNRYVEMQPPSFELGQCVCSIQRKGKVSSVQLICKCPLTVQSAERFFEIRFSQLIVWLPRIIRRQCLKPWAGPFFFSRFTFVARFHVYYCSCVPIRLFFLQLSPFFTVAPSPLLFRGPALTFTILLFNSSKSSNRTIFTVHQSVAL
jgi:hypothetical protein